MNHSSRGYAGRQYSSPSSACLPDQTSADNRCFLKAIQWARKYGLRINIDLHTVPGSQNGWNHSGRLGNTNFLLPCATPMRRGPWIMVIVEFISQP